MTDFTIIENTKEARKEFGYLWGSEQKTISVNDIEALITGKQLALEVNQEYVVFVTLESEDKNESI